MRCVWLLLVVLVIMWIHGEVECGNREYMIFHDTTQQATQCNNADFSIAEIKRELSKTGFHRLISTKLWINFDTPSVYDKVLLAEKLSENFFVDEYEVTELFK
jgi:hypothetical protein